MMRRTIVRFLSLILIFSFVFCTGCKEPEKKEATPTTKSEGTLIGMSFDSFVIERWTRDRDVFISKNSVPKLTSSRQAATSIRRYHRSSTSSRSALMR